MSKNWEEIRRQHAPQMWSIAWRILKHESDALDCCQNVFIEVLERSTRPSEASIQNWGAYLRWLTTRRSIDMLRKRKRTSEPCLLGVQDVLQPDPLDAAETTLEYAELMDWVRIQLAEMQDQTAECFWLCCVDEMSYADAAKQLGISTSNVGVKVHRARAALKKQLAKQDLKEDTKK